MIGKEGRSDRRREKRRMPGNSVKEEGGKKELEEEGTDISRSGRRKGGGENARERSLKRGL